MYDTIGFQQYRMPNSWSERLKEPYERYGCFGFVADMIPFGLLIAAETWEDDISGRGLDGVGRSINIFCTAYELSRHTMLPASERLFLTEYFAWLLDPDKSRPFSLKIFSTTT